LIKNFVQKIYKSAKGCKARKESTKKNRFA